METLPDYVNEYHKIAGPFRRHTSGPEKNKLIVGEWTKYEFRDLAQLPWIWTEKLDGTNIRIHWDGHRVSLGGRTARAILPQDLVAYIEEQFPEELFEQKFGETKVTLIGEGLGAGIQKVGGNYSPTKFFSLFDVRIGHTWLLHENVVDIAGAFGIPHAPVVLRTDVWGAIEHIKKGLHSSYGNFWAEGLVGTPACAVLNRNGERVIMKLKHVDLFEG